MFEVADDRSIVGSILLVDDEKALLEILVEELRSLGYTVETAHDGLQALEKVKNSQFKVMITYIRCHTLMASRKQGTMV